MSTFHHTIKRRSWQKLWNNLDQFLAPHANEGVILAVSGGPDSRALLEAVASWPNRNRGRFLVVSIDHKVRVESYRESQLVLMRARRLGFDTHFAEVEGLEHTGEMELRNHRYEILQQLCQKLSLKSICTAHHLDDNAEGFMMNLMGLGGGTMGAAMNEVQELNQFFLIRPLLSLSKNDLRLALNLAHIFDYATDSLDEAEHGRRAMVRHNILPNIAQTVPHFSKRLENFARKQASSEQSLARLAQNMLSRQENGVFIAFDHTCSPQVIEKSIKLGLKELCPGRDHRSAAPVVKEIIKKIFYEKKPLAAKVGGLDRPIKWFKVSKLNARAFYLPGAKLFLEQGKISILRV